MREKVGALEQIRIEEEVLLGAVVAGLVMLDAIWRHAVAQCEQKIVAAIVACAEKRAGFRDQLAKVLHFRRVLLRVAPDRQRLHGQCAAAFDPARDRCGAGKRR